MVTYEQVYLMISIPVLWNALLFALGIAFIEWRSAARERGRKDARNRRRVELKGQGAVGITSCKTGGE